MNLVTKRLIIRNFNNLDLEDFHRLTSNIHQAYLAGFKPHSDKKTSLYQLQSIMLINDYFAITLKDGTLIGDVNYYRDPIRKSPKAWQIGFILDPKYKHQGYMQEALKAFIEYLAITHEIEILTCVTMINNFSAQKTIEAVGFQDDGIIRKYKKLYNGDIVDCKNYSMTNDEIERNVLLWQKN